MYIAEVSPAARRGELVTWSEIALNVGILLGFVSGFFFINVEDRLEWRLMFLSGAVFSIVVIIMANTVMPESPRWLVDKGNDEEAKQILKKIYPDGKSDDSMIMLFFSFLYLPPTIFFK